MRTFYLNPTVYNKMYACMQYPNALALRASLETGLRIDDILSLSPKQLNKRTLVGIASKTKKPYKRVLSVDLSNRLRELSGEFFIFEGRCSVHKHRTRQAVWKDVKKASKILNLDGNIAPHSARKTYAVEKFKDGGLATVKKDLQHKDISTTMLYAFADYLDELPGAVNSFKTNVRKGESAENDKKGTNEVGEDFTPALDGKFWETFADLVAEKTAERLIDKLKATAF